MGYRAECQCISNCYAFDRASTRWSLGAGRRFFMFGYTFGCASTRWGLDSGR